MPRLTARHEAGRPKPRSLNDAPTEYIERQLRAIVSMLLGFAERNPGMTRVLIGDALVTEDGRLQDRINQLVDRIEASLRQSFRNAVTQGRLPHDTEVDLYLLRRVEASEQALRALGFRTVRVRCHGDLARIEVDRAEHPRLLDEAVADQVTAVLTGCGFQYVTLDLRGYRMGSFNVHPLAE